MVSFKLFCILFLGVMATSLAASVGTEDVGTTVPEASNEVSDESDGQRGFSHDSQGNDRCSCDNISCQCCVSPKLPKLGKIRTCLRVIIQANQKSVGVQVTANNRAVLNTQFRIGARESACAAFPGSWNSIKGCVDTDTSNLPNNAGVQTCPKLQLKTVGATVVQLIIPCVQLSNRRVSFNDRGEVKVRDKFRLKFF